MVARSLVLALALTLAACSTPAPVEDPRRVWCEANEPRRDATPETPRWVLDEINAHNARGTLWCDWRP